MELLGLAIIDLEQDAFLKWLFGPVGGNDEEGDDNGSAMSDMWFPLSQDLPPCTHCCNHVTRTMRFQVPGLQRQQTQSRGNRSYSHGIDTTQEQPVLLPMTRY